MAFVSGDRQSSAFYLDARAMITDPARLTVTHCPRFTLEDAQRAADEWGANCGPGALAAVLGLTLEEVRPHLGDFGRKHYTNPSLMLSALRSLGARWTKAAAPWPRHGLVRVQWEGPWTKPGVPMRARYRHTHWIGAATADGDVGVFDINCINNGTGWVALADWERIVVPWILKECEPKADGHWHPTHVLEIFPAVAR